MIKKYILFFRIFTLAAVMAFAILSCQKNEGPADPVKNSSDTTGFIPTGSFPETFEYGTKSSYLPGAVELNSGSWYFSDAVTGNTQSDEKDGKQSARIRNKGKIIMLFDRMNGADTVFIKHAVFKHGSPCSWELWMSSDSGNSWSKTGKTIISSGDSLTTQAFIIRQSGKVRFEILKTSGDSSQINIDDIAIGDFSVSSNPGTSNNQDTGPDSSEQMLLGNPDMATSEILKSENYLMVKPQYCLSYACSKKTANWVSWHLSSADLGSISRQNNFRADLSLPDGWYKVSAPEFSGSGFDRGHMCPSGDRTSTVPDNSATFLMTNMIPQAPNNNQITWANLENYCRTLVKKGNELYIICGPYGKGGTGSKGYAITVGSGVVVPSLVWKIILVLPEGDNDLQRISTSTRVISVVMPNTQTVSEKPWETYRVSVDSIENLTGYDFLSEVSPAIQSVIEARVDDGPSR